MQLKPRLAWTSAMVLVLILASLSLAADAPAVVLDSGDMVRFFMVGKTELVKVDGEIRPVNGQPNMAATPMRQSPAPAADWAARDFDDGRWARARMPLHTGRGRDFSLLCARANFLVDDPAGAKEVRLAVAYSGGVVVYLNGREIARGDMPEGKIDLDTPANDYPKDAYLDSNGHLLRIGWGDQETYKDRFALRVRRLEVELPADGLVKGVNVLAVEAHRPLTDAILFTGKPERYEWHYCPWETLAIQSLKLTASRPLTSATPGQLVAWNQATSLSVTTADRPIAGEKLQPVQIAAVRNGGFVGQVVVGSPGAIAGLKASAGALAGPAGRIDASAVEVRFGRADMGISRQVAAFDSLTPKPPTEVAASDGWAVTPVWITVNVPADAKAGEYRGQVTVSADGAGALAVPVVLTVADWTLPPVTASESWWWAVQSPDTLAMAYGVPMWSDRHVELIGQSFDLLRQVGTRIIYVPLFAQSYFGNEHGMVRWVKGTEGDWKCDFTPFEKCLDAAVKHLGRLEVICIHAWPVRSGGAYFGKKDMASAGKPWPYTQIDPKTGELTNVEGPTWDEEEKIRALLRPAFEGIRRRIKARGLDEKVMMVGIGHDVVPSKAASDALKDVSGAAEWVVHCHPHRSTVNDQPVGYLADVWGSPTPNWPGTKRSYSWQQKSLRATFPRAGSNTVGRTVDGSPPAQYRASCESAMLAGLAGYGWIGGDCWEVKKDRRGQMQTLMDQYPLDHRSNLGLMHAVVHLLGRGPEGPVATVRQQMVRAGLQEAEARAFIEKALQDAPKRAKMSADVLQRCRKVLEERQEALMWARMHWWMLSVSDWDAACRKLYDTAADVSQRTVP